MSAKLHPLLVDPTRLSIVGLLAASDTAEFGFVRDAVGLSDSALSKQLSTLARNDLVELEKRRLDARRRTWVQLTDHGRETLTAHVEALQAILARTSDGG